jgi:hypothetical protein
VSPLFFYIEDLIRYTARVLDPFAAEGARQALRPEKGGNATISSTSRAPAPPSTDTSSTTDLLEDTPSTTDLYADDEDITELPPPAYA